MRKPNKTPCVCPGFYWPIGLEEREPIVLSMEDDAWAMKIEASSFERFLLLRAAGGHLGIDDEMFDHGALSAQDVSEHLAETSVRFYAEKLKLALPPQLGEWDVRSMLAVDEDSPDLLLQAAQGIFRQDHVAVSEAEQAEKYLRRALHVLPEFADATFALSFLLRRFNRVEEAAALALEGLCAPPSLSSRWHERVKALAWLKSLRDEQAAGLGEDPLWRERKRLTLKSGERTNDDFLIYEAAVSKYLQQGRGVLAVRLRATVGELMSAETASFQARYNYSDARHREMLRRDVEVAGLDARLPLLPQ